MKKQPLKNKLFRALKILGILWLLSTIIALFFGLNTDFVSGNVAVIPIHGVISVDEYSSFTTGSVCSECIIDSLDKADKNPGIKAIIIDINSPGGSGVASDEIGQKIKSINKTTVAVIREMAASGGYWIASSTDYIFANRLSITGSIGVIGSYLDFSGFINEYNVTYQRYVSGELKDMNSPFKTPSEKEREVWQKIIDKSHEFFVEEVAMNRNLDIKEVEEFSTGQVFLGVEAFELGLVDELGTKQDAVVYLEEKLNITADPVTYEKKKTFAEMLNSFNFQGQIGKFINPSGIKFI